MTSPRAHPGPRPPHHLRPRPRRPWQLGLVVLGAAAFLAYAGLALASVRDHETATVKLARTTQSLQSTESAAMELRAEPEAVAVSFTVLGVAGVLVVVLVSVAVIGEAVARRRVGLDQVIWLGALLVAIPVVREQIPGMPPAGAAVDWFVFLPAVVIVAVALVAALVRLVVDQMAVVAARTPSTTGRK